MKVFSALNSLILCLLFSTSLFAQEVDPKKEAENIKKAKIKSQVGMFYGYDRDGFRKDVGYKDSYKRFNTNGQTVAYATYGDNTTLKGLWKFAYDANGNITKAKMTDVNDQVMEEYTRSYNSNGDITKQEGTKEGASYTVTYTYNKAGKLTKQERADDQGFPEYTYTHTYDSLGNRVETNYKGKKTVKAEMRYNEKNQLIQKKETVNGKPLHTLVYEYNDKGQKIKEQRFLPNGDFEHHYKYTYDEVGNIKTVSLYEAELGYESNKWLYAYDSFGNITKIITYQSGDKKPSYVLEYIYEYYKKKK